MARPNEAILTAWLARLEDTDLGSLIAAMRDGDVQARLIGNEQRRSSTRRCRHMGNGGELALTVVLDDIQVAVAARDVQSLSRGIVEHVVGIADDVECRGLLSGVRIEYERLRGSATTDEYSVAGFVERHRVVGPGGGNAPCGRHRHRTAVDDGNLFSARHIDEHAGAAVFELERLGMSGQSCFSDHPRCYGINRCEGAAAESDVHTLCRRIVSDVVRVIAQANHGTGTVIAGVDELQAISLTIRHSDGPDVSDDPDTLRLAKSRQALQVRFSRGIDHFDSVIPQRRDVEPVRRRVEGEVIDPPFDTGQFD